MRMLTIEEIDQKLADLKTRHDKYVERYSESVRRLQALKDKYGTEKFKVGDAVFSKKFGNMIVKEVTFENNEFVYCCVGAHSGVNRFFEKDIEPISLGNQVLYRK